MKQYLDMVKQVLEDGTVKKNRTGINTLTLSGLSVKYDLRKGFPAITTRKLAFKAAIGEMVGFLRSYKSAADFRTLGCKVWDQNANENKQWLENPHRTGTDDLGEIYGVQWRRWPAYKKINLSNAAEISRAIADGYKFITQITEGTETFRIFFKEIDQVRQCLDLILNDPGNRRILFHGWNPAELDNQSLPSCHLLYSWLPDEENKQLDLVLYMRSNDIGLGHGFNAASAAAMLTLFSRLTGYNPRWLTIFISDAHIYENHVDMLSEQLKREPFDLPSLKISDRVPSFAETGIYQPEWLDLIEPSDFSLEGYVHHSPLTAPMAV